MFMASYRCPVFHAVSKDKKSIPGFVNRLMRAMVLFDEVIEVLDEDVSSQLSGTIPSALSSLSGFWIGGILVDVDHTRSQRMSGSEGFVEKALGCLSIPCRTQPEIKRVSC
jgi:hypothetical protein